MWEHDYYPYFYFPLSELKNCTTRDKKGIKSDGVYRASVVELSVSGSEGRKVEAATTDRVLRFTEDRSLGALTGLVRLEFKAMGEYQYKTIGAHGSLTALMWQNTNTSI